MTQELKEQDLSKIALKGSAYNLINLFVLKFGGLIFTIILARMLLPELFGIFALALSLVTLAITFTNLGIDNTLLRYLSQSFGENNISKAKGYLAYLIKFKSILVIIVIAFILIFSRYISYNIYQKPLLFYPLLFSCFYLISESFRTFFAEFLIARKDFRSPALLEISTQGLKIFFSIAAIMFLSESLKVSGIFVAFFISSLLTFILSAGIIYRRDKELFNVRPEKIEISQVNSYWKFMIMASVSLAFFGSIDMLMLGKFVEAEFLGYYRAAMSLVLTLATIFSLSSIFLPIFTQIHGKRFIRGFQKTIRYILILSIPATIGALFLAKYLIKIVYGNEYFFGTLSFYFLTPLIITTPLIALYSVIFQSKEKPNILSNAILISLISNVVFNLVAIFLIKGNPLHLIAGIAAATSLSRVILLSILVIYAKKQFNFKIKSLGLRKPLFSSFVMGIVLFSFNRFVDMNLFFGIVEVLLGVIIYLFVMILVNGLGKEDWRLFQKII